MKILNWKNGTCSLVWNNLPFVVSGSDILINIYNNYINQTNQNDAIKSLCSLGMTETESVQIIDEIVDKFHFAEQYTEKSINKPTDKQSMFTLNLTRRCNLNCKHCYASGNQEYSELTKEDIKNILTWMNEILVPPKMIVITGGEPTLEKEKLFYAIEKAREFGFKIRLNSNGILFTPNLVDFLRSNNVHTQISLDGIDENTHAILRNDKSSFQKAIDAIDMLKAGNALFSISMTTYSSNVDQIPDMIDLAIKKGADKFTTSSLALIGNAQISNVQQIDYCKEFSILYNSVKDDPRKQHLTRATLFAETVIGIRNGYRFTQCGTGNCTSCFDADGILYPCINMIFNDYQLCNVKEKNFKQTWLENKKRLELQKIDINTLNGKCAKCFFKYFCGGFCRGETLANGGKITDPYIRCKEWRKGMMFILKCLAETPNLYSGEVLYE